MRCRLLFFGSIVIELVGRDDEIRALSELWAPFVYDSDEPADPMAMSITVGDPVSASAQINRTVIAACLLPAVHAGVVVTGGGAVVIPGVSGAGKSTLTAALCQAGAGYVSDEALVLDDSGKAVPYPRPIALSHWSVDHLALTASVTAPTTDESARELLVGPTMWPMIVRKASPITHVVLADRTAHGITELTSTSRSDALRSLVLHGFNHHRDPPRFLRATATAVSSAHIWRLSYSRADDASHALLNRLG